MNQKGFVNIAVVIGIVIMAGIAGYFILSQRTTTLPIPTLTQTPPISTSTTPTTNSSPDTISVEKIKIAFSQCLPSGIKLDDVVSANISGYSNGQPVGLRKVTVEQKLTELNASCNNGKLVDSVGKEITFYRLTGCWGNPPYNYQEIMQKQQNEINKLKEQYTVVEMTCNPSGIPKL